MKDGRHIAMWGVPRSLATVLGISWANRPDTHVFDEPLLGPYVYEVGEDLTLTRDDIRQSGRETSYPKVIENILAPPPAGKSIVYQKHQPHNLLPELTGLTWLAQVTNCFLIRSPKDMLLSLHKLVPGFTLKQTGWTELKWLFDYVCQLTGKIPPIIDAADLQNQPRRTLSLLCEAVGVEFSEAMLSWPSTDSSKLAEQEKLWNAVAAQSTAFQPYKPAKGELPEELQPVLAQCQEIYEQLYGHRLH